jgi:hypothetical protein
MAMRRKRCRFCGELFGPDPRLKNRQHTCRKEECQRERHRQNCTSWNREHQDQFVGRYRETLAWLADHRGYLGEYRRTHPEAAGEHRVAERERLRRRRAAQLDIQDSIRLQALVEQGFSSRQPRLDIQDSIWRQLFVFIGLNVHQRSLDKQDSMPLPLPRLYASGEEVWRWAKHDRRHASL